MISATAQAAFAPLRFHQPTRSVVREQQAIGFAYLCTVALVALPTQAMPIAGTLLAVWRVESEMLVPQGVSWCKRCCSCCNAAMCCFTWSNLDIMRSPFSHSSDTYTGAVSAYFIK